MPAVGIPLPVGAGVSTGRETKRCQITMLTQCPMGHTENLSHEEIHERLKDGDYECREEGCNKKVSYPIDHEFHKRYITTFSI